MLLKSALCTQPCFCWLAHAHTTPRQTSAHSLPSAKMIVRRLSRQRCLAPTVQQLSPHSLTPLHLYNHASLRCMSSTTSTSGIEKYDITILGGGMVGSTLAVTLATNPLTAHLRIALIEANAPAIDQPLQPEPYIRVSSITPHNAHHLQTTGVWPLIERNSSFTDMQVWQSYNDSGRIHWQAQEYGVDQLGYIVENDVLQRALFQRIHQLTAASDSATATNLTLVTPAKVQRIGYSKKNVSVSSDNPVVRLEDGRLIASKLLVGADGPNSAVKKFADIGSRGWDYNQRAVVANVRNSSRHTTAWQRFLPTGPVALLPVMDGEYSNVVWSTTPAHAQHLTTISNEQFLSDLNQAFHSDGGSQWQPGGLETMWQNMMPQQLAELMPILFPKGNNSTPPPTTEVSGKRLSFPLRFSQANNYVDKRIALIGDSAHVIHPLAGQGVNLGLGDAMELAKVIAQSVSTGGDIGSINVLKQYETQRQRANLMMMSGIDLIGRIYSINNGGLAALRSVTLDAFNAIPWVKKQAAMQAMGLMTSEAKKAAG